MFGSRGRHALTVYPDTVKRRESLPYVGCPSRAPDCKELVDIKRQTPPKSPAGDPIVSGLLGQETGWSAKTGRNCD